jgi:Na+-transporting NADH:ubiquinone oxidoreductase subunit F
MILLDGMIATLLPAVGVFFVVVLVLVALLLFAKAKLLPSGKVKITINGDKVVEVEQGSSVLQTLANEKIHLPSACGGKGSCGQCKCQIISGGGDILPSEVPHFSRKQIKDHWRLGCQAKVKGDMEMKMDESILGVKEWECEVISNKNVATFIKEFKVQLPPGEHMHFEPGSYAQIRIPKYDIDYDRDMDKSLIGDLYIPAWKKFGLFGLKQKNTEETIRAYSMANYPDEGDIITLTVRIATPPFKPKDQCPNGPEFQDVPCGIASTYIFSLKPGDKVTMSGPYGEFRPVYDSKREMIWVGGGAGMAPLRAQIMHMLKTRQCRDREMHYFYGARAIDEVFFMDDFLALEKEFPNFHFHLALDRPDPKADSLGVKYTPGFIAPVMGDTYLKAHEAPEDIEYYLCGPPMMAKTVLDLLHSLGVEDEMIRFDNFGG